MMDPTAIVSASKQPDVRDGAARPRVSFLLFTYNQETFIEAAMRSALAQTYEPLEIIVSDDCSPDNTFAVMERIASQYRGPHTLRINRNMKNLGMGAHYQHVFDMANGEILILAAGDDISASTRSAEIVTAFESDSAIGLVYSDMNIIDVDGKFIEHYKHFYAEENINSIDDFIWGDATIFGASFAISREIRDIFPQIMSWNEIEDRTLIFRCLVSSLKLKYLRSSLVEWRRVGRSSGTNQQYSDPRLNRLQRYLPDQVCTRWVLTSFRQNLVDCWSVGTVDAALRKALQIRCAELELALALWSQGAARWRTLWTALRTGARICHSLKIFLKFRFIGPYLALIEPWRRIRQSVPRTLKAS